MVRSVVIIPARYGSSRFPGKPLVQLLGKPMVLWVAELSARAIGIDNVYVATESKKICDVVEDAGFKAVMTTDDALTGTDRLAQAADKIKADVYINVQGDEPIVDPRDIIKVRDAKLVNFDKVINAFCWLSEQEDPSNVNIPKVVANEAGEMLYMSRSVIPGFKDVNSSPARYKKQVCIYAFTYDELVAFHGFGRKSCLERNEDIEILRFRELGKSILMVETRAGSLAVDVPDDVARVEAAMSKLKQFGC